MHGCPFHRFKIVKSGRNQLGQFKKIRCEFCGEEHIVFVRLYVSLSAREKESRTEERPRAVGL